ncbi:SRPBCC family protein [Mycobacterium sp. SMC-8]|uniref:SRPBCC family protein n=1 Tax=Mycobacterium sp. SMC-8 TaxID=2857060 RepID=UPI0021B3E426|nr:SRPBCC family protein [Mycobacterium sp. SMC-8]
MNEFTVDAPLDDAWAVLTDIPTVVRCVPGAELDRHEGADYHARVTVKVGPIGMTLAGKATLVSQDDAAREMVVSGTAADRKGNGSTEATVRLVAREQAGRTVVTVTTDVELSGRIAQFGKSAIVPVSNRIIGQFVERLDAVIAGGPAPAPGATGERPSHPAPVPLPEWITLAVNGFAGLTLGLAIGRWLERLRPVRR